MGTGNKMLGVTCNGLASHPRGVAILLVGFGISSGSVSQFGPSAAYLDTVESNLGQKSLKHLTSYHFTMSLCVDLNNLADLATLKRDAGCQHSEVFQGFCRYC